MNGLIWIGQIALAGVFLTIGTIKLFAFTPLTHATESGPRARVAATPRSARILGLIEVLLAFGVLMPDIYTPDGVAPEFLIARVCAAGLGILMLGAAINHIRRKQPAAFDFAISLLALFVIVGRWPS
jgi:uncharacterized membrane protein YphA (DoxX/SURF4 family)